MFQSVAECCRVLQSVAVCCVSVNRGMYELDLLLVALALALQRVAESCTLLQRVAMCGSKMQCVAE